MAKLKRYEFRYTKGTHSFSLEEGSHIGYDGWYIDAENGVEAIKIAEKEGYIEKAKPRKDPHPFRKKKPDLFRGALLLIEENDSHHVVARWDNNGKRLYYKEEINNE